MTWIPRKNDVKTLNNPRNKFVLTKKFVIMSKSCIVHTLRVFADFVLLFGFLERMMCILRVAVQYQSQDPVQSPISTLLETFSAQTLPLFQLKPFCQSFISETHCPCLESVLIIIFLLNLKVATI